MKTFITIQCLLALTQLCQAALVALPYTSQYHIQDASGQYSYGYSEGLSTKQESKSADGRTTWAYSYVQPNRAIQSVNYVADAVNGLRIAHSNLPAVHIPYNAITPLVSSPLATIAPFAHIAPLIPISSIAQASLITPAPTATPQPETESIPETDSIPEQDKEETEKPIYIQDTPEVKEARAAHLKTHAEATKAATQERKRRSVAVISPSVFTFASPLVASSQYNVQDDLGQYSYGYTDGNSAKSESRSIDGTTNGAYSYVDENGLIQSVQYTADSKGFRVAATNLPGRSTGLVPVVSSVVPAISTEPVEHLGTPEGPQETPEVIAAKTAHFAAHNEAKARLLNVQ